MTKDDIRLGEGTRAHHAKKRHFWLLTLMQVLIVIAIVGVFLLTRNGVGPGAVPPLIAVAAAIVAVLALNIGGWLTLRHVDEMELRSNLVAATFGFYGHISAYCVWAFLWSGGLAGRPDAAILVMFSAFVGLTVYCWRKFR